MERRAPVEKPEIRERGGAKDGQPQFSERRLFMQLQVFTGCRYAGPLIEAIKPLPAASEIDATVADFGPNAATKSPRIAAVVYEDINDPQGVGILMIAENPEVFMKVMRPVFNAPPFASLTLKPEFTMLGRTYSLGYEPDLEETLFTRPTRTALNPAWNWAVWYPLRRSGEFAQLPPEQQRDILSEHGTIGRSFGEADYAHDIRLACHGLDKNDNDFVIGLVGKDLHPLSAIVQTMRRTKQTSLYLERLGPFFVGRAVWKSA